MFKADQADVPGTGSDHNHTSSAIGAGNGGRGRLTVLKPEAFTKAERLTVPAQTKVTPSEYKQLEQIRDQLKLQGLTDVTISSLVRTFVIAGIRAFNAESEVGG
jgi:hypothetical protein